MLKTGTGKELEILRRLLLFVQLKAVPPIINFPKGQGQDSDFFFLNNNDTKIQKIQNKQNKQIQKKQYKNTK